MIGSPFFGWLLTNLVWASAAMLLVLAIRQPVARLFGAGAAYALWLIPLCRLLAPPPELVSAWFSTSLPSLPLLIVIPGDSAGATLPPSDGPGQWVPILLAVWAGGAILFLAAQAVRYRGFLRGLRPTTNVGRHDGVTLLSSRTAEGPLAIGLIRRRIVVPADFAERYSPGEQRLALAHERHHHRRGDILANHVALAALALNWCNPIAWFAFRAFRADQEMSCDAAVMARAEAPEARSDYAHALVKSASPPGLVSACPLNSADQLKRRLRMLSKHRHAPRRLLIGSVLAVTLSAAGMMAGAPVQAQGSEQQPQQQREERRIVIVDRPDGQASTKGGQPREERRETIIRRSPRGGDSAQVQRPRHDPEIEARVRSCREGSAAANIDETDGNNRTRIMICSEGATGAQQVDALQRARDRLAQDTELSAETKERVLAQLDQAIARARSRD